MDQTIIEEWVNELGPTNNKIIWKQDLTLKSHLKDWRGGGSILESLDW